MKLSADIKQTIQCFVYFLFNGHYDHSLIILEYDYRDKLIKDRQLLLNCFILFVYDKLTFGNFLYRNVGEKKFEIDSNEFEKKYYRINCVDYIHAIHNDNLDYYSEIINEANIFIANSNSFWCDFIELARCYCFEDFPQPIVESYLSYEQINGTDSVPPFAIWTNILEVDYQMKSLNGEFALRKANQRMNLPQDARPIDYFSESELDQEIY